MALTFHSGGEMGLLAEFISSAGTIAISTSNPNTGNYSIRVNPADVQTNWFGTGVSAKQITFSLYVTTLPSRESGFDATDTSSTTDLSLTLDSSGVLRVYDSSTLRGTSAGTISGRKRISVSIDTSLHKSYTFIDGVVDSNLNGISTGVSVNNVNNGALGLFGIGGTVTADVYFDDIVCGDASGSADIGNIRCAAVASPNAVGNGATVFDTLVPAGGDHYTKYDDAAGTAVTVMDDDYCEQAAKAATVEIANINSCSDIGLSGSDVIDAVNVCCYMSVSNTKATVAGICVKDNGTEYNTSKTWAVTTPLWKNVYYATMPNGGAAWTQTRFDAFQIGACSDGASSNYDVYLYCAMAFVAYHAGAAVPTVTIQDFTLAAQTTITFNGNITDGGGSSITERGVCYNTTGAPTTADSTAHDHTDATGAYTEQMTSLTAGTTYHCKAYAINSTGTGYSTESDFVAPYLHSLLMMGVGI